MKFLFFFIPLLALSQTENSCAPSCNDTPIINKIVFIPPNQNETNGIMKISGEDFPICRENTTVTMAEKPLQVISVNKKEILAQIHNVDYQNGTYRVQVKKTNCRNVCAFMDATINISVLPGTGSEFTTRKTSNIAVYPYSYTEVVVACDTDEKPVSGGFVFSTWEMKLVSSHPEENLWRFKIYNNESVLSSFNEFFAICVR